MSLHPEDGQLVRAVADRVEKANARERAIRLALVLLATVCVIAAAGFGAFNTYRLKQIGERNEVGVRRIVECTTVGYPCFDEQKKATDELVATFLIQLNESHLVIECTLFTEPQDRTKNTKADCEKVAQEETRKAMEEFRQKAAAVQQEAEAKVNGGRR